MIISSPMKARRAKLSLMSQAHSSALAAEALVLRAAAAKAEARSDEAAAVTARSAAAAALEAAGASAVAVTAASQVLDPRSVSTAARYFRRGATGSRVDNAAIISIARNLDVTTFVGGTNPGLVGRDDLSDLNGGTAARGGVLADVLFQEREADACGARAAGGAALSADEADEITASSAAVVAVEVAGAAAVEATGVVAVEAVSKAEVAAHIASPSSHGEGADGGGGARDGCMVGGAAAAGVAMAKAWTGGCRGGRRERWRRRKKKVDRRLLTCWTPSSSSAVASARAEASSETGPN
jgi:hypothetical protein